jgi:hypothetical protein
MRYFIFLFAAILSSFGSRAQKTAFKFQWKANPSLHQVEKQFENAAAVYITDERIDEYIIEEEGFFFYRTLHRVVHLNNDKGIESFNKIYLPFDEGIEMIDVKARTILPGGKVIEMNKDNIKDLKDDDGEYKIFALEGLTRGCEVEYYFTIKKYPSYFGREILSSGIPSMSSRFELITPEHLLFETKSFNNLPESKDSVIKEKRHHVILDQDIEEAEEEKYSIYQANLKRVEFKLSYNKAKSETERLFTWSELARKVYAIYSETGDKEMKKIKSFLDDIGAQGTEAQKITAIENYVKKNIITRDDIPDDDAADLAKVIKNKMASHKATCKLYVALMTAAGVNFQIVLGGDRADYTVDRKFENWNNTQNF